MPRVSKGAQRSKRAVTYLSAGPLSYEEATKETRLSGSEIATAVEAMLDRLLEEERRYPKVLVDWRNAPTETGWYMVDRDMRRLVKISDDREPSVDWHERLYVYESAVKASREHRPMVMYLNYDDYGKPRLVLDGDGAGVFGLAAQRRYVEAHTADDERRTKRVEAINDALREMARKQ